MFSIKMFETHTTSVDAIKRIVWNFCRIFLSYLLPEMILKAEKR